MSKKQEVLVTVAQDGGVQIETSGFSGSGCKDVTKALEKALGTVTSEHLTREYRRRRKEVGRVNQ